MTHPVARASASCRLNTWVRRFGRFPSLLAALLSLLALLMATPAHALYRYDFVSDPLTVTWERQGAASYQTQERMFVSLLRDSLFTPETTSSYTADLVSFSIGLRPSPGFVDGVSFTFPMSANCNCTAEGDAAVVTLDSHGLLPISWAVWATSIESWTGTSYGFWSNNMTENFYISGWDRSGRSFSMSGSFVNENGGLGGAWTVAAVPEGGTATLFLAGVALLVLARRHAKGKPAITAAHNSLVIAP